jgi:hypothetical protein
MARYLISVRVHVVHDIGISGAVAGQAELLLAIEITTKV